MFLEIERKIINGERLNRQEALFLFKSEDLHRIGELAEEVSKKLIKTEFISL